MDYKEKILEYFFDESEGSMQELFEWIDSEPLMTQLDIVKEFKGIIVESLENCESEQGYEYLLNLGKGLERLEERILDEQVEQLKYEMAIHERDKVFSKIDVTVAAMRDYVIDCITTNADNAKEMRELAIKVMDFEKETGTFDVSNWKGIL